MSGFLACFYKSQTAGKGALKRGLFLEDGPFLYKKLQKRAGRVAAAIAGVKLPPRLQEKDDPLKVYFTYWGLGLE